MRQSLHTCAAVCFQSWGKTFIVKGWGADTLWQMFDPQSPAAVFRPQRGCTLLSEVFVRPGGSAWLSGWCYILTPLPLSPSEVGETDAAAVGGGCCLTRDQPTWADRMWAEKPPRQTRVRQLWVAWQDIHVAALWRRRKTSIEGDADLIHCLQVKYSEILHKNVRRCRKKHTKNHYMTVKKKSCETLHLCTEVLLSFI